MSCDNYVRKIKIGLSDADKQKMKDEISSGLANVVPSGSDTSINILAKTSDQGIWIGTDDGNWYYWDEKKSSYVLGGLYQGLKGDKGDSIENINFVESTSKEMPDNVIQTDNIIKVTMSDDRTMDFTVKAFGMKGETGNTATIDVGTTETLEPEDNAYVKNVGDNHNGVFNFGIPKGKKGDKGDIGNGISYARATAVSLSSSEEATAEVSISGDDKQNQILNFKFGIPNGEDAIGGIVKFEVINGILYMHYATEQKPDIYLITKDNYETLGVDKSLIGNLVFIY